MPRVVDRLPPKQNVSSRTSVLCALVCCVLGTSACSEDHRIGGVQCGGGLPFELIDDMEDRDPAILQRSARAGTWYAYNDMRGVQSPSTLVASFPMAELAPPRHDSGSDLVSNYGAATSGSGFSEWGAGIAFDLNVKKPYDASMYTGVGFWIRSRNGLPQIVKFGVSEKRTVSYGGVCIPDCETCPDRCEQDFGRDDLAIDGEWRFVELHWDEMQQPPWAEQGLVRIDERRIYGLKFQAPASEDFDFVVDDVAFACTAPSGT